MFNDNESINEETSIFGFRALIIRQAHERLGAMEEASIMMIVLKKRVLKGLGISKT